MDGQGRNVALVWLFDHRGGYALLLIDSETGKSEQYPIPFAPEGDCPFTSILSSGNRFYTHFNSHFVEFDPAKRAFTFWQETAPRVAMGMTEDDNGVIWAATYPDSGVVSFNPKRRELKDYGHVYKQNWMQYQRYVAADEAGWIYFAIGFTASQIIAFDPRTGEAKPMLSEAERLPSTRYGRGTAYVYRDLNGKVYGLAGGADGLPAAPRIGPDGKVYGLPDNASEESWHEFYKGERKDIGKHDSIRPKPIEIRARTEFPDGKRVGRLDLIERLLQVEDPKTGRTTSLRFDYTSEGAHIMGLAAAPDGTICGGTTFPMCFFSYNPKTDKWTNSASYGQWNTVARQGDRFFAGGYGGGFLLEWDPSREWVPTDKGNGTSNPRFLTECSPAIHRPHDLLAHPDGKTLVLAGTPGYGFTGGGLLFWDRQTRTRVLLEHADIIPEHSTMSLVALPDGKLLGGTTISPGTGGEQKAKEAELYIMDMPTKRVEWHAVALPGVWMYTDMCLGPDGLVYGVADRTRVPSTLVPRVGGVFFVFDPARRKIVHEEDTLAKFGPNNFQQGPRVLVLSPQNRLYVLFTRGIAHVEPGTFSITMLFESPVPVGAGGDIFDGRLYFASGSHVYSYKLPGEGAE